MDLYVDYATKFVSPNFAKPDEKEGMIKDLFENTIPRLLGILEAHLQARKYICGDKLTTADFLFGGLYCNAFTNDAIKFGKDQFKAALANFPNFKAYGERFAKENQKRLSTREP